MKTTHTLKKLLAGSLAFLISLNVLATPEAIESRHYLELSNFTGQSFLQTMIDQDGIVELFNTDYEDTYKFPSKKQVAYAIDNFDRKNKKRILRMFGNSKTKLFAYAAQLRKIEKTFTPETMDNKVGNVLRKMKIKGNKYALAQFMAIASGAGTLIRIDEDNYYYNIGYYAPEVRSGRSYGATRAHNANDASHLMYLRELEHFLKDERNDFEGFYTAIMKLLVDTDVSAYDGNQLNKQAEAVLTDYITVYTAELRRHLMKKLHPTRAPWGNDMTEATFLSLFNASSELMMLQDGLVKSSIKEHWALSRSGSGRSGFGINRRERRKLQTRISEYYRNHELKSKRNVVKAIDRLIGKRRDGDVYRGVMEFINNKKNLTDASRVEKVDDKLVKAFVNFLMEVYEDTYDIVEHLDSY